MFNSSSMKVLVGNGGMEEKMEPTMLGFRFESRSCFGSRVRTEV